MIESVLGLRNLVGELPIAINEAIDSFRIQLGAAIDSIEFVKRALDRPAPETPRRGENND
jgi:hypothetical protein